MSAPAHGEEHEDVEGNEVDDEDISTPGGDHVEVGEGCPGSEIHGACSVDSVTIHNTHRHRQSVSVCIVYSVVYSVVCSV